MLDVLLDLRTLIIDRAEDGEARERHERQCGRDGQHREPCLNAEAAAPHEQSHDRPPRLTSGPVATDRCCGYSRSSTLRRRTADLCHYAIAVVKNTPVSLA